MAIRPIYIPKFLGEKFVETVMVEFRWFPGMSKTQKQKSIDSLHESAKEMVNVGDILEISSKSKSELGYELSAFNLMIETVKYRQVFSVESAFQSSKVFENGGPFIDLLNVSSREAKKDERIRNSGELKAFKFCGREWPLEPKTIFYDWLYINALNKNNDLKSNVSEFSAFTDIEFNPNKSINCQAYSAALYVSLQKRGLLEEALLSEENYISIVNCSSRSSILKTEEEQPGLF